MLSLLLAFWFVYTTLAIYVFFILSLSLSLSLFYNSNATEVMDTPGWNNLVTNHPSLVGDAFKALALLVLPRKRRRLSSDQTSSTS